MPKRSRTLEKYMESTRHVKTQIENTTQEIKHLICNETKYNSWKKESDLIHDDVTMPTNKVSKNMHFDLLSNMPFLVMTKEPVFNNTHNINLKLG